MNALLSSSISELQEAYGVVVVGSGYGGGITAARPAERGHSVCVLERGKGVVALDALIVSAGATVSH